MNKSLLVAALLIAGSVTHVCAEEKPDFSVLARRYRISVYNTYREDRPEYDRRQLLGRMAEWMYSQSSSNEGRRAELLAWVDQATASSSGSADVPPLPGQSEYSTVEQFAEAIQYDEKAIAWLRNPSPTTFVGVGERRPRTASGTTTPTSTTRVSNAHLPTSQPTNTTMSQPVQGGRKPSVLSRVLGAVTGADGESDSSHESPLIPTQLDVLEPNNNSTETEESVLPSTVEPLEGGDELEPSSTTSEGAGDDASLTDDGELDEVGSDTLDSQSTIDGDLSQAPADATPTTLAEHKEVLVMLQEQLESGSASIDLASLERQTSLIENWFSQQTTFEGELTSADDQATLVTLRTEGVAATQQLKDLAAELLLAAEGANDPSAAHQGELKQLRSVIQRLEDLVISAI